MRSRPTCAAALAVLLCLALPAGARAETVRAERPTYQVGDRWIRSDGLFDLVRIENDRYIFASGPGREIHLSRDLALARLRRGDRYVEFDPAPKLGWPLEVGKSGWNHTRFHGANMLSTSVPATVSWKVEAVESVTVADATLQAFRVAFGLSFSSRRTSERRAWSAWYAPDVKQWVKVESDDMQFLHFMVVAFERAAPAPLAIALDAPRNEERVATAQVELRGKASGGRGIARVAVSVNGVEVSRQGGRGGASRPEVALRVPLTLEEGRNVVLVTAIEPDGATRQEARVVFFDKPTASAPRPIEPPREPAAAPPASLRVALTSPSDQSRVEHETLAVAGVASSGRGVARVVVALNGVEVGRVGEAAPQPALSVNLPLKLREGQNTLVVTATDAGGAIHQEVRTVQYEKRVPLTLTVKYPPDGARVTEEGSVVAAVVASSKGVARVRVTLNGAEVSRLEERTPQKSLVVSVPLTLRPGANAIALTASEPDGTVQQEIRTVVYEAAPAVAAVPPAALPPPARDQWAVVIGVGRYDSSAIPTLPFAVPDAETVSATLTTSAGFKKDHVLLLTDTSERKPTLRNVKWALGTFLGRSAQKDDTVLIYFAGHGAPEVDTRGVERDGLAKYLIPRDADPDDLYSTALPMDELQTIFGRIEAERVVVFLDACYSGAAGGRTFASKKTRAGQVDDLFLERLTRSRGRAIVTASRPAEVSLELPELGHGIFTYYMVQGLRGAADLNRDGIVTLQELYEYLEQQVTQKARLAGGNQHPVMKGELEGVLPLVKVGK